ncbi:MAG: Lrp/AsnC family transcriptional regulator [Dehalococcoidales bacterium]|nr:Lrp/AsnC family transcriptional regulator [Dehalococcoidales bacterium]
MDDLDDQIVRLLEEDARQTSDMIAKQVNVSPATVRRRLKRLIDAKELHIDAHRDLIKSGFPITALIGLSIEHKLYDEVITAICKLPEVLWASTTIGRYDAFAFVRSPSNDHLYLFLKDVLNKITGIKESETFLCLRAEKSKHLY